MVLTSPNSNLEAGAAVVLPLIWIFGGVLGSVLARGAEQESEKLKRASRWRLARLVRERDDEQVQQLSALLNEDSARYNERLTR